MSCSISKDVWIVLSGANEHGGRGVSIEYLISIVHSTLAEQSKGIWGDSLSSKLHNGTTLTAFEKSAPLFGASVNLVWKIALNKELTQTRDFRRHTKTTFQTVSVLGRKSGGRLYALKLLMGISAPSRIGSTMILIKAKIVMRVMINVARVPRVKITHFISPLLQMSTHFWLCQDFTHQKCAFQSALPRRISSAFRNRSFDEGRSINVPSPALFWMSSIQVGLVISWITDKFLPLVFKVFVIFNIANSATETRSIHQSVAASRASRGDHWFTFRKAVTPQARTIQHSILNKCNVHMQAFIPPISVKLKRRSVKPLRLNWGPNVL